MASERDFELLDDYLRHQLNAGERAAFEQRLEADQALKSEYNVQQKIAEGLRQARVSELKTMLNNVPLPAGAQGGTSLLAKFGMGIGASLLVALGIYYFSTKEEATETEPQQTIIAETKPENTTPTTDSSTEENQPKQELTVTTPEPASKDVEKVKPSTKKTKKSTPQEKVAEKPVINAFDPSEESDSATKEAVPADKEETVKKPVSGTKIPVEAISGIKKYNFHYQFKDGRLMLYGSFEKDLYEIMEFFGDNNHTLLFLFYKNNFYLLDEQNEKIKPLTAITDPTLLQKLRASKAKGN